MSRKTIALCRLCRLKKELRFSHILPEFFYDNIYDEKHRAVKVTSDDPGKGKIVQKGEREHLLCKDCEGYFSKYEVYAAPIVRSIPSLPIDPSGMFLDTPKVDYKLFKLFQMSLLWRASVSKIHLFSNVDIGKQEERLRRMLVRNQPGKPHNFGCIMVIVPNTTHLMRIIGPPTPDELEGRKCFRFQTGEIYWYFFASSFPKDHVARELFLLESGELRIWISKWSEQEILRSIANLIN